MIAPATACPANAASDATLGVSQDPSAFVTESRGRQALDVMVRGARCGACLARIETAAIQLPGVQLARLNLSTGQLRIEWTGELAPQGIIDAISAIGYGATAFDPGKSEGERRQDERQLLIDMTVAGVAIAGVMLLSEAVWFGSDMSAETRTMLHWASAVIAIPASAFSGRTFFSSALTSIRAGRLNMDVPISLAVILAIGLSIFETARGGLHAYFDASVMLLFFLLIGRFLDARLRRQAYAAANALAGMQTATATRLNRSGAAQTVRASDILRDDVLLIAVGERLTVDAIVVSGLGEVDLRLVTGEVEPVRIFDGQVLHAGAVNLTSPLHVRALAPANQSLIADIARLLEAGEQKKSAYRRIADRAASLYVPLVHITAVIGFVAWMALGASIPQAAFIAMTVLIITCPCAMALAAPLVQVVASARLFREGAYLASGDALERIATVNHVILDKTGTLTLGDPVLIQEGYEAWQLQAAAQLARASRHPFSRAIARAAGTGVLAADIVEHPGSGIAGIVAGRPARLGRASFAHVEASDNSNLWFWMEGKPPVAFRFEDQLRPESKATVAKLHAMGLSVELLSGDSPERVERAARAAGISTWRASATPQSKARHLAAQEEAGVKVLMVGDGLNDVGALAGAHASLAPGGAIDVSRLASDCVYSGDSLASVAMIIEVARKARKRIRENFAIALIYNLIAIPIALAGWATPLVAAIAMSGSSAVVTLNALRLSRSGASTGRSPR